MTAPNLLAEYKRLAERLTLPDGRRPLMRQCQRGNHGAWQAMRPQGSPHKTCDYCGVTGHGIGYIPHLDLRDGQPVVPLDLVLQALRAIKMRTHLAPYMHQQRDVDLAVSYGNGNSENITEAVLVAANAVLDAREKR